MTGRIGKSENQALRLHCYKKCTLLLTSLGRELPCLLLFWSLHLALPRQLVCPWNLAQLPSPPVGVVAWGPIFAEPVLSTRTSMECLKGETKVIYPHSSWTHEDMLFVVRFLLLRVWSTKDNINQALAASPEDSRLGILLTQEGLRCKAGQEESRMSTLLNQMP